MYLIKKNINRLMVNEKIKIQKILEIFTKTGIPICFAVNKKKQIVGSLTDGDIRRSLLKGYKFSDQIDKILNKSPLTATENYETSMISYFMKSRSILYIPLVNKKRQILGLYSWNNLEDKIQIDNTIIIMAGGFGKRLRPLTNKIPKPMLKIGGKPILEHLLFHLKSEGARNIIITVHYKSNQIKTYFKDGKKYGLNIKYLKEDKPMGTAGFLKKLSNLNKPFIVINGDIVCNINLKEFIKHHKTNDAYATMAVRTINNTNPYGVIKTRGGKIVEIIEKPTQTLNINAGIYLFNNLIIKFMKKKIKAKLDMNELFNHLNKNKKKVIAFPLYEKWQDVGTMKNYFEAKKHL